MSTRAIEKYRPVLTASQISHICMLARKDAARESISLLSALASFEYKILQGAITPAYSQAPKTTLVESLGFVNDSPVGACERNDSPSNVGDTFSLEESTESDESLYEKWLASPSSLRNIRDLERVRTYRYTNNKMTMK